jgi:hypothetical protein
MARPSYSPVVPIASVEGWDAIIDTNFTDLSTILFSQPIPLKEYALVASLPTASNYTNCLAMVNDPVAGYTLYFSDGVSWIPFGYQGVSVADSVAATVGDVVTDFNSLLASLRAAGIIAT